MRFKFIFTPFFCFALLLLSSCKEDKTEVKRAFYFWKNTAPQLTENEEAAINELGIQRLYVKFFEVSPDEVFGAIPVAKTALYFADYSSYDDSLTQTVLRKIEIIPTVFVRNEALKGKSTAELDTLASNTLFLIQKFYRERFQYAHAFTEIQIDCDWTPSTKDNYFKLLRSIKRISKKTLSCTLRLYPYKYSEIMGIPPVDKVTLMCYNLINPLAFENKNSILENNELEAYLKDVATYPLHIDIALPIFSWMQLYQNKQFSGILDQSANDLKGSIKRIKPLWYEVTKETTVGDLLLREGDLLKAEDVSQKTITQTIQLLKKYIPITSETTVSLFHLDNKHLKQQKHAVLRSFFTDFSQ